ncbi:uncharacterized protein LY89DRAFT_700964 [Mollisia scopiformis]|uniref:Uncharacterized protein n=1 Tax=Mollisia scopiformis TaxID=149040 RepID=A0A132BBT0_MOLSC|nr:uncharacterized protein LY89DRAFT_700964 [Mollisia scopiformis]KUJ09882.1 hypothetical protein LY89DRAFT_700964 [Mollisia scopiformis]
MPLRGKKENSATLADPVMLEKIDKLFACNVGNYIDLPQIVVVGDQSSGKSSGLEGLTDLPFPRDSTLCTRFATQIIFRRSSTSKISAWIIPAKSATTEHIEQVRTWSKEIETLDQKTFTEIMHEVHKIMEISNSDDPGRSNTFSEDVLCLEVSGPEQQHFSVIDVPGIFKRTTQGVTNKADMQMVKSMVQGYMENPRSVILAIIPANVDIATQEILEMAEEVDPEGQRTLGVLTKPDLVDKGTESGVGDLIEGRKHQLNLGWHLVRNPGQLELSDPTSDRHALEKGFFETVTPFNRLAKDRVGIPALKLRLQEVLATHTRREFPKVKAELNKKLKDCRASLLSLGASRDTTSDQREYLMDIVTRFQKVTSLALGARYWADQIFNGHPKLCLATRIVGCNETFSKAVEMLGHTYEFEVSSTIGGLDVSESEIEGRDTFRTRAIEPHNDIEDILCEEDELSVPLKHGIHDWLTSVYNESRGFELGTFDPSLLAITLTKQSMKWDSIALGYVSDAATIVHNFITDLLQLVCPDDRVRNGLMCLLIDELLERYKRAVDQVKFVLEVEKSKPATQNHYFNDTLEKCRQKRMQEAMSKKSFDDCTHGSVVRLDDIMVHHPMSNVEHTVQDLHDILRSYYQVAWKRVVDVICMQATEYHLMSGPATPLRLLSPSFLGKMTSEQMEEIAGEDARQKRQRKQLQKEIEELEKGKKILM